MNLSIQQEIRQLSEFFAQNNEIGIVLGAHQNFDTVASALSLYLSLQKANKNVQIVSKKEPTVEVSNLVGVDKISQGFSGGTSKLVISLPYVKGEVEKVLFTEAPSTINFHLTAAPGKSISSFGVDKVRLNWEGSAPQALIAIGVGNVDELMGLVDVKSVKTVNIDNHPSNTRFGDIVLVDDNFSSLSEVISKIVKEVELPMDIDIAQNTLDGVLFATRNFTKSTTSPLAFEAVSSAMYQGAQRRDEANTRRDLSMFPNQRPQPAQHNQDRSRTDQRQQRQRVSDTDFPAMHMQGQTRTQMGNQDRRPQGQQKPMQQQNQRPNQNLRPQQRSNSQPQFGQNPHDIEDLMRKIKEENARPQQKLSNGPRQQSAQGFYDDQANEGEIVQEHEGRASFNGNQGNSFDPAPQDDYQPRSDEEVPDDWLMPKVFKSSKNNN